MMNIERLKEKAIEFEALLALHSKGDKDIYSFYRSLLPLIESAKNKNILQPVQWEDVPNCRYVMEGDIRQLPDLEKAYSEFKIELTGGEPLALKLLRQKMGKRK